MEEELTEEQAQIAMEQHAETYEAHLSGEGSPAHRAAVDEHVRLEGLLRAVIRRVAARTLEVKIPAELLNDEGPWHLHVRHDEDQGITLMLKTEPPGSSADDPF